MIKCFNCGEETKFDFVKMSMWRSGRHNSIHFHIRCFEAVAGEKYTKALEPLHFPNMPDTSESHYSSDNWTKWSDWMEPTWIDGEGNK